MKTKRTLDGVLDLAERLVGIAGKLPPGLVPEADAVVEASRVLRSLSADAEVDALAFAFTELERAMLRQMLDQVQVPGAHARTYVTLREKLLGNETEE